MRRVLDLFVFSKVRVIGAVSAPRDYNHARQNKARSSPHRVRGPQISLRLSRIRLFAFLAFPWTCGNRYHMCTGSTFCNPCTGCVFDGLIRDALRTRHSARMKWDYMRGAVLNPRTYYSRFALA